MADDYAKQLQTKLLDMQIEDMQKAAFFLDISTCKGWFRHWRGKGCGVCNGKKLFKEALDSLHTRRQEAEK